jgi:hypothetical protein
MKRTWLLESRKENVTGDGRNLHSDELHNYLGDEMKESEGACMTGNRNALRSLVRKPVARGHLTGPSHRWEVIGITGFLILSVFQSSKY